MFFFQLSLLWAFSSLTFFHTLPARAHDFFELCLPPGLSHCRLQLLVLGASSSLNCLVDRLLAKSAKSSFHTAFLKPPPCPRSLSLSLFLSFFSFLFFSYPLFSFLSLSLSFFFFFLSLSLSFFQRHHQTFRAWRSQCLEITVYGFARSDTMWSSWMVMLSICFCSKLGRHRNCRRWRRGGYLGLFQPLFVTLFKELMRRILPLAQKYDCSNRRCW